MHVSGERWRLGLRPGLDGLRGIAILLVLVAHAAAFTRFDVGNAGGVGVTLFFALSGFLITSLLVEEHHARGRVSFVRFYERRARRLLPALLVYLAVWVTLSAAEISPFHISPGEVVIALVYLTNWLMAAGGASHPIGILWSLAVEEQFYLLWPLTFLLARRWPRLPLYVAMAGAGYAVVLRAVLWSSGTSAWSLYYRSDTRMDSLLIGCLFAIAMHRGLTVSSRVPGVVGLATVCLLNLNHNTTLSVVAGPFLVPVAACAIIAAILAGHFRWLSHPVLRWFGRRSYALYLWHYPLVALAWNHVVPIWVAVPAALAAAEASWWLVERPFTARRTGDARTRTTTRCVSPPTAETRPASGSPSSAPALPRATP